ncbi:hypothetical protein SJAG_04243 [Schizosaccharomyces japonicus yFS275]|uniref:Uncharacterized protein n=1 Tax=Schizosaccharomyces japonicus (strain yFS275 / FY16936) TaxID=402676 RepID=B6K6B5_SCHJY|nr:hypothetical protein SJAG_04243 [Schizosaccharomyces japonicus yFS275]EEB09069.1 hypothetical protein SJAG_04243 [Schizosaccharomyces japonicus yFS275]
MMSNKKVLFTTAAVAGLGYYMLRRNKGSAEKTGNDLGKAMQSKGRRLDNAVDSAAEKSASMVRSGADMISEQLEKPRQNTNAAINEAQSKANEAAEATKQKSSKWFS